MSIVIRECTAADVHELRRIAIETFDETFRPLNSPETMDAYLAEAFDGEKLLRELSCPESSFHFLYLDGELAGYLKTNVAPAQSDRNDPSSLEIERIYVRRTHKGKGLGKALIEHAMKRAAELAKSSVWLGVWEKNIDALGFYRRMGFVASGRHSFRMGSDIQSDLIMTRMLAPH